MRKNYQILLCESFYENGTFIEKPVCEVGSSTSTFSGQAFNVEFYTKIDGTHELTFNLPRYYFDEYTGERVKNGLVELIVNKSRLELTKIKRDGEIQTFYLVVNNRKDKEEKGVFSYEYSCGDAYIEELAKNGYGVVFDDDVEGNGLGDIHHFSNKIAENSGWEYDQEKTGTLREYTTDIEWNVAQNRYDEVKTLVPVNEVEYISELERYCYKMSLYRKKMISGEPYLHHIYCYNDSQTITGSAVKNMLYNGDDFTDTVGWQSWYRDIEGKEDKGNKSSWNIKSIKVGEEKDAKYYMRITNISKNGEKLLNDTCASSDQAIVADTPYVFKYQTFTGEYNKISTKGYIKKVSIYDRNPLTNYGIAPDYTLELKSNLSGTEGVVIKTKKSFSKPFFVFELSEDITIDSIEFFPVQGVNDEINLQLLKTFFNGYLIKEVDKDSFAKPDNSNFEAYTEQKMQYFIRDNYAYQIDKSTYERKDYINIGLKEETVTYLNFEEEINIEPGKEGNGSSYVFEYDPSTNKFSAYQKQTFTEISSIDKDNIPEEILKEGKNVSNLYMYSEDGKYYQYYRLPAEKGYKEGGTWDYAFLGSGDNGKRRTYKNSKSNRFNLIQDIAELFKVWPVFETYKNSDGTISKKFYFKEEALKENFSGFHRGVNLVNLTRTMDSENIVTKIFVEDQENQYAENGFVTIRTSKLNPWGENFYYNFQYYVNQELINVVDAGNGKPIIENDLNALYLTVKPLNEQIIKLNAQNADLAIEIKSLKNRQKVLSLLIASNEERIASAEADLSNQDLISNTDKETLNKNISAWETSQKSAEDELKKIDSQLNDEDIGLQAKYDKNVEIIEKNQKDKISAINVFESKYQPYIKEGVWFDNSYVDNDTYFVDSQKVMSTSSKPKLEWTINVIDGSMVSELENFEFEVGDKTILVDNEFFGIEKNGEKNYTFEVLISGIKEVLDNATKNTIEVRNYNTSFEELFERISAATQTLELNEQTYNKGQYFTSDGELDADILQKTLLQNSLILANASDNSYVLDETGLSFQSLLNPNKKVRLLAEGLFLSNETDLKTGASKWTTGITAEGINASLLTAGEINTANIKIFTGSQVSHTWNGLGITAYKILEEYDAEGKLKSQKFDNDSFIRFDQYGFYFVDNNDSFNMVEAPGTSEKQFWFEGLPRSEAISQIKKYSTVSITEDGFRLNVGNENNSITLGYLDKDNNKNYGFLVKKDKEEVVRIDQNGNAYFKGEIKSNKGDIAGWEIKPGKLCSTDENGKVIVMQSGSSGTWAFAAGGTSHSSYSDCPFRVDHSGNLYATGVDIEGTIKSEKNGNILMLDPNSYDDPVLKFSTSEGYYGGIMMTNVKPDGEDMRLRYHLFYNQPKDKFDSIPILAEVYNGQIHLKARDLQILGGNIYGVDIVYSTYVEARQFNLLAGFSATGGATIKGYLYLGTDGQLWFQDGNGLIKCLSA